jgi:hypothetical protein
MKKQKEDLKLEKLQVRIDKELKKKFRIKLVENGMTETEFIIKKIKEFTKKP